MHPTCPTITVGFSSTILVLLVGEALTLTAHAHAPLPLIITLLLIAVQSVSKIKIMRAMGKTSRIVRRARTLNPHQPSATNQSPPPRALIDSWLRLLYSHTLTLTSPPVPLPTPYQPLQEGVLGRDAYDIMLLTRLAHAPRSYPHPGRIS